jgi:hypothetical protein
MANEAMQDEIDRVLSKFSGELLKLFQKAVVQAVTGRTGVSLGAGSPRRSKASAEAKAPKAPKASKAAKARHGRGGPKSSPEEVAKLGDKLVELLKRKGGSLTSKELQKASGVGAGQFQYALNKAKRDGRIHQIGERRMARYEVGSGKPAKAAKAKAPKAKPAKAKAPRKVTRKAPAAEAAAVAAPAADAPAES